MFSASADDRRTFKDKPMGFWSWFWRTNGDADMPQSHQDLLGCIARGYPRTFITENDQEVANDVFARTALWYLWANPGSFVYWAHLSDAADQRFYNAMLKGIEQSRQFVLRQEFAASKERHMVGRSYEGHFCGLPISIGDLVAADDDAFLANDILLLLPHFDLTPTPFIKLVCARFKGPRVQIAAATKA